MVAAGGARRRHRCLAAFGSCRAFAGGQLQAADRLPAHDLLDRVYHQGEVIERYRLAVPEAARASVEANLRALLLLALDIDAGGALPEFAALY